MSRWYFGGVSSSVAACLTHPLDLIKVKDKTNRSFNVMTTVAQFSLGS